MEQSHLEILLEDIRAKFDLVLEGHAALLAELRENRRESNEKHDLTAFKLEVLNKTLNGKVDALAADLAAHRADTEAHPRYLVRE